MSGVVPTTRPQWKEVLDELPATPEKIPAFFFAHGRAFAIASEVYFGEDYSFVCISRRANVALAQGTTLQLQSIGPGVGQVRA